MAAGFKTATVNASDVPATQTNFPAYVDLSRLGITTLAEAQSVRVYADSAKTTEWAREIVSATEMHVKIPSLTSSTVIYVDWDGVSADYAVTDTYGRNAVWSGYGVIVHGDAATDSSGKQTITTTVGSPTYGAAGQIGDAVAFDGNDAFQFPSSTDVEFGSGDFTISMWVNANNWPVIPGSYDPWIWNFWQRIGTTQTNSLVGPVSGKMRLLVQTASTPTVESAITMSTNTWYHIVTGRSGSNLFIQVNNETRVTAAGSGTLPSRTNPVVIGGNGNGSSYHLNGEIDELRALKGTALSTDWITTEYNNQSDEAGFWGTWTDAGGGASRRVFNIS